MRDPSGEAEMCRPWPFSRWLKDVRAPVCRLKATRFWRAVTLVPGAAPAGRAWVKLPVAYTVLPTVTIDHTTPLTWTVPRPSADAVGGFAVLGGVGAVSADATVGTAR